MKWLRSIAAELFPSWHEKRLLRQLKGDDYVRMDSMARLQSTLLSAKHAEEREETTVSRGPKKLPE